MVIWNKDYDVVNLLNEVTIKISSSDSNYIVDVLMQPKFGNCRVSMKEVSRTSVL